MAESTTIQKLTFNRAITDSEFAKEIFRKLPMDSFDTDTERTLAKEINRYYLTNDKTMTEGTLKLYIEGRMNKGLGQDEAQKVIELIEGVYEVTGELKEDAAVQELDKHIRRSLTLKTLKEFISQDRLEDEGALEELGQSITEIALIDTLNSGDENFLDLFNDTEKKIELYKRLRTKTHPTGFRNIDDMLDGGGLGRGEVALFIAGTGQGKSTWSVQMATNYAQQGLNVMYVTLEEKMERMAVRLESNLLGAQLTDFYNEMDMINEDLIKAAGASYKANEDLGNIYISKHNPREVSIEKLEQIIIQTKLRQGLDVDVMVIDYPALMAVPGRNKIHEEQGELFERIRGLSQKYNFIAVTLAQTNRTAWAADVVTLNNIEGGFMVANACEMVLTINRTQEEYEEGFFRMHVDKVRNRSTKPIPNMLSFAVDTKGYRIRATSPQEQEKHMNILKQAGREDDTDGFGKANATADKINSTLQGGF